MDQKSRFATEFTFFHSIVTVLIELNAFDLANKFIHTSWYTYVSIFVLYISNPPEKDKYERMYARMHTRTH